MASTIQEAIKRLRYVFTSEGADKVAADLNKVSAGQAAVTATSTATEKASLSLDKSFGNLERRFNSTVRAQQDFEKVQQKVNAAVAQNPALQARANLVLAQAAQHFDQVGRGQRAMSTAMGELNARMAAMGGGGGIASVLTALGPAGIAAAAGIGAVTLGLHSMVQMSNQLADKAGKMVDFAETTGLTTTQLQALQKAAAFVGIDVEKVGNGFERFSVQLEELRRGTGGLHETMSRINPALTEQLAKTRSAGEAWDVFSRAVAGASREQANALSKGAFGRTGIAFTRLAGASVEAGGLAGLEGGLSSRSILRPDQLRLWDELKDKIDYTSKTARDNIASIFATPVLQAQLAFVQRFKDFSEEAKNFSPSQALLRLLQFTPGNLLQGGVQGLLESKFGPSAAKVAKADYVNPDAVYPPPIPGIGIPLPQSRPREADPRFVAAQLRETIAAMGEAATYAMRLDLAQQQLAISAKDAGLTSGQLAKAQNVLKESMGLQQLQAKIGMLGELASATDVERAAQQRINLEIAKGNTFTDEQIARMKERNRLAHEYAQLPNQLGFERDQLGRNDTDATVAARLRSQNLPVDLNSAVAQEMRLNEQLRQTRDLSVDLASGGMRDFRNALLNGASAFDVFRVAGANALNKIADKLMDMAAQNLVAAAFGGTGGGLGGLFAGLFGGAGGQNMGAGLSASAANPSMFHNGGVAGVNGTQRYIHPAYFENAPRYHGGGVAGLAPDEVPAILRRGEPVFRDMAHAREVAGGASVTIVNNNDFRGADPGSEARMRAYVDESSRRSVQAAVQAVGRTRANDPNYLRAR